MSSTYHKILQAIMQTPKLPQCEKYLILVQGKRASKCAIAQDSEGSNAAPPVISNPCLCILLIYLWPK